MLQVAILLCMPWIEGQSQVPASFDTGPFYYLVGPLADDRVATVQLEFGRETRVTVFDLKGVTHASHVFAPEDEPIGYDAEGSLLIWRPEVLVKAPSDPDDTQLELGLRLGLRTRPVVRAGYLVRQLGTKHWLVARPDGRVTILNEYLRNGNFDIDVQHDRLFALQATLDGAVLLIAGLGPDNAREHIPITTAAGEQIQIPYGSHSLRIVKSNVALFFGPTSSFSREDRLSAPRFSFSEKPVKPKPEKELGVISFNISQRKARLLAVVVSSDQSFCDVPPGVHVHYRTVYFGDNLVPTRDGEAVYVGLENRVLVLPIEESSR